ncbi:hypothetical protein HUK76_16310 [Citrobacter portucalensis]|uniref:hypothetical protein n=1 Tax=Citrobacter portucalensis TaxID=1639133 RepID=UPI00157FE38F|nr:hypothetical protein [Citrobacter portucalensis]NUH55228.1 hypothetical protein [Citrobacter portucalensis]
MEKYVIRANKNHTVAAREAVQLGISKAKALNCELKLIFATFNQHAGSTVFNEAVGEHINSLLIKKRKCKISDVSVSIETQQTIKKTYAIQDYVAVHFWPTESSAGELLEPSNLCKVLIEVEWAKNELNNWITETQAQLINV